MDINYWKSRVREALAESAPARLPTRASSTNWPSISRTYRHALSADPDVRSARAAAEREAGRLAHAGDVRRARAEAFGHLIRRPRGGESSTISGATCGTRGWRSARTPVHARHRGHARVRIGLSTAMFACRPRCSSGRCARSPDRLLMLEASTPSGAFGKEPSYLDASDIARETTTVFDGGHRAHLFSDHDGAGEPQRRG